MSSIASALRRMRSGRREGLLPGHARRTERPALVEKEPRAAANIEDPPASDQAHLVQHPREGLGL
jgi:hypothetical protein